MAKVEVYDGIPFFIGTGQRVSFEDLKEVTNAIYYRTKTISNWVDRYNKGEEVRRAIIDKEAGAVQNVNMTYAFNAYFKFLHQSLLSLRDTFRLSSNDFSVELERPTQIIKGYLEALQTQNDLLVNDAIIYGCASVLLDINTDTETPEPDILINHVKSAKIIYDYEQPGAGLFTIRVTPEMAHKLDFLPDVYKQELYNRAVTGMNSVAEIRVYVGELVVNGKMDDYVAIIFQRRVIYAEKGRALTSLRSVSIFDRNDDCSPIYSVLKASELNRDTYKMIMDYSNENVNPIRVASWNLNANTWEEAKRLRFMKQPVPGGVITQLVPGPLDINGIVTISEGIRTLSQQATGLNEYTLGESGGSVRTAAEAMMLQDSAAGILNIFANKLKQQLILPILEDLLEILKVALGEITDLFPESLFIDTDIAKDQQEANILMSLINMPMFGAVIQGLDSVQALQLFRWVLEKLHISGTNSIFDVMIQNAANNLVNNNNNQGVQRR